MAIAKTRGTRIRGIVSCVPPRRFDNARDTTAFDPTEVEKVVRMAGVKTRHVADETICSSDLCVAAGARLLDAIGWERSSVDALVFVTQTPDYLLPSTSCLAQHRLGLPDTCAAMDIGLGCSGYPYGLWIASSLMANSGLRRVLLLHGETPTRFSDQSDRAVALLFGDAGSATALESAGDHNNAAPAEWWFDMHSDGSGWRDLILEGGGFRNRKPEDPRKNYVAMEGANVFNFTIRRVPPMIDDTLKAAGRSRQEVDYFIFHQSNQFIMRHLAKKAGLEEARIPFVISEFGSSGGPSVPLTITRGGLVRPADRALSLLLLGYGVGLSWGSALVDLPPDAVLDHLVLPTPTPTPSGPQTPTEGKA